MELSVEKINELLRDLDAIRFNKPVHVEREKYSASWSEVYDKGLGNGAFVKLHLNEEDSYGGDVKITGIEFVKGKEKTITVYES